MSTIKVDNIDSKDSTGNITFTRPIVADISNVTGTLPSARLDTGTGASQIVQMTTAPAKLPAIDGSNLTGITHTPANDSVGGAQINLSLIAGDTMYASGTDTLARLAKGTDGEVMTLTSGVPSWVAAGGGLHTQIGSTTTATTSASVDFTSGIGTTYKTYLVLGENVKASTNVDLYFRVGDSSGFDSGGSDYAYHHSVTSSSSTSYTSVVSASANAVAVCSTIGSATANNYNFSMYVYYGGSASQLVTCKWFGVNSKAWVTKAEDGTGHGVRHTGIVLDRFQFVPSSGTLSGDFSLFGIN